MISGGNLNQKDFSGSMLFTKLNCNPVVASASLVLEIFLIIQKIGIYDYYIFDYAKAYNHLLFNLLIMLCFISEVA